MAFAMCPEGGLPRVIRFCYLGSNTVAMLHTETNLLLVDRTNYDRLEPADQELVFKTHSALIVLEETKPIFKA